MKPGTTEAIRAGCLCPVMDNFCGTCGRRYWVRASDQSQTKVRRFVSPESDERHQCTPTRRLDTVSLAPAQALQVLSVSVHSTSSLRTPRRWSLTDPTIVRPRSVAAGGLLLG